MFTHKKKRKVEKLKGEVQVYKGSVQVDDEKISIPSKNQPAATSFVNTSIVRSAPAKALLFWMAAKTCHWWGRLFLTPLPSNLLHLHSNRRRHLCFRLSFLRWEILNVTSLVIIKKLSSLNVTKRWCFA